MQRRKKEYEKGTLFRPIFVGKMKKMWKRSEALTNNHLQMYLKQHGLKISGSKADLTKRVLSHARGNAASDVLDKIVSVVSPSHFSSK